MPITEEALTEEVAQEILRREVAKRPVDQSLLLAAIQHVVDEYQTDKTIAESREAYAKAILQLTNPPKLHDAWMHQTLLVTDVVHTAAESLLRRRALEPVA